MNSFYKGGSELPTVKVSSCSHRIKSKKLGLLDLKLVAHFRLYFTSIDKALVKHSLSTDKVLFTQLLRKRLEKGKTCYQGTCQLLYTYLIIGSRLSGEKPVQKPIKSKTFSLAFFLTNFAPTSAVHAFGHQSSVAVPLVFPEGEPKTTRRNTEQRWEKGRSWLGIDQVLKINRSRIIKFLLCCTVFVSMFSLSAQTPRKDNGADGLFETDPIHVGDRVPDDFYTRKYKLFVNGEAITTDLRHLKGKLVILDFWASWCGMCLTQMNKAEKLTERYTDTLAVLLVNSLDRGDDLQKIKQVYDNTLVRMGGASLPTVYGDEYLLSLFPHSSIPRYVWISPRGTVLAITGHSFVNSQQIDAVIDLLRGQGNYD